MRTHNVRAQDDLGIPKARRILPGKKAASILWERMRRRDDAQMPPLASNLADQEAVRLIGAWIDSGAR